MTCLYRVVGRQTLTCPAMLQSLPGDDRETHSLSVVFDYVRAL